MLKSLLSRAVAGAGNKVLGVVLAVVAQEACFTMRLLL
jgi:hypothetical protein